MIRPIFTLGNTILRKEAKEISKDYPKLNELIADMFETMHNAEGVGLAAPQIGLDIRLLVIDLAALKEDNEELSKLKLTMINPTILEVSEEENEANEGCLSIPGISEKVKRASWIKVQYYDADFKLHTEEFEDFAARVVQHEYDHIDGILFTDLISPIRRQMIKSKLINITKGKIECSYKIKTA